MSQDAFLQQLGNDKKMSVLSILRQRESHTRNVTITQVVTDDASDTSDNHFIKKHSKHFSSLKCLWLWQVLNLLSLRLKEHDKDGQTRKNGYKFKQKTCIMELATYVFVNMLSDVSWELWCSNAQCREVSHQTLYGRGTNSRCYVNRFKSLFRVRHCKQRPNMTHIWIYAVRPHWSHSWADHHCFSVYAASRCLCDPAVPLEISTG